MRACDRPTDCMVVAIIESPRGLQYHCRFNKKLSLSYVEKFHLLASDRYIITLNVHSQLSFECIVLWIIN